MPTSPLYTTQQAADALGLTTGRVRQIARSLRIGQRIGRDWVFTEDDIERIRQRNKKQGRKPTTKGQER
mgnify:FL=1